VPNALLPVVNLISSASGALGSAVTDSAEAIFALLAIISVAPLHWFVTEICIAAQLFSLRVLLLNRNFVPAVEKRSSKLSNAGDRDFAKMKYFTGMELEFDVAVRQRR
jgi:hypothetical protein